MRVEKAAEVWKRQKSHFFLFILGMSFHVKLRHVKYMISICTAARLCALYVYICKDEISINPHRGGLRSELDKLSQLPPE